MKNNILYALTFIGVLAYIGLAAWAIIALEEYWMAHDRGSGMVYVIQTMVFTIFIIPGGVFFVFYKVASYFMGMIDDRKNRNKR